MLLLTDTCDYFSPPLTFHDGLQRGHLLLPLAAHLVDGLLLGALRHGGHGLDVLHVGLGLGQLLLDAAQLRLGPLQGRRLPLQLLWRAGRVKLKIDS